MRGRTKLTTAAVIAVLSAVTTVGPASTAGVTNNVIGGTVLASDGSPVAGATIQVSAMINSSPDLIRTVPLVSAATAQDGTFTLSGSPTVTKDMRNSDGSVSLQVLLDAGDKGGLVYQVQGTPPSSGNGYWTWAADDPAILNGADTAGVPTRMDHLTFHLPGSAPVALRSRRSVLATAAATGDGTDSSPDAPLPVSTKSNPPACPAGSEGQGWIGTDSYQKRMIPVQRQRTLGHSTVKYFWDTTTQTKLGIAVAGTSTTGGFGGGLSASHFSNSSAGMNVVSGNNISKLVRMEWEYRQWEWSCANRYSGWVGTGYMEWRPNQWTGGNDKLDVDDNWTCNRDYSALISSEVWAARSEGVTYAGWFSVHGVTLDSSQTNSSSAKLTFTPNSNETARICGRGGYPVAAATTQAKEVVK